jgi:hypothetical protein
VAARYCWKHVRLRRLKAAPTGYSLVETPSGIEVNATSGPGKLRLVSYAEMAETSHPSSVASAAAPIVGCVVMLAVGLSQVLGCFALMEDFWGWPWFVAILVMALLFFLEAGVVVSAGCFFGALLAWRWPWWGALLLAAPGLVTFSLILLGVAGESATARLRRSLRGPSLPRSAGLQSMPRPLPKTSTETGDRGVAEIEAAKDLVRASPDSAEAHYKLGRAYAGWPRRYAEAIGAYREAVRLSPHYPEAFRELGLACLRAQRWQEALEACTSALSLDPTDSASRSNLGVALGKLGRWEEAIRTYQECLRPLHSNSKSSTST